MKHAAFQTAATRYEIWRLILHAFHHTVRNYVDPKEVANNWSQAIDFQKSVVSTPSANNARPSAAKNNTSFGSRYWQSTDD